MSLTRRRFLTISAAAMATRADAGQQTWAGRAFGGDISLTLQGPREVTDEAIKQTLQTIRKMESLFSLYDPTSALSTLNSTGKLTSPAAHFQAVMQAADQAYTLTNGLFDPTIQPLWQALAYGRPTAAAIAAIGWPRVTFNARHIQLDADQALTFNGIAQGYATDVVTEQLRQLGLTNILVNMGEYRGVGAAFKLGLSDPSAGHLGTRTLTNQAIATSSPSALTFGQDTHILHATHRAKWSTVSVEATTATFADCLSTALCLAGYDQIVAIKDDPTIKRITLVDFDGNLTTV